jgi:adenylylsulfate kinase-like enzyme
MIINLTGQAGAGKSTIAKELMKYIPNSINIDGDELREIFVNKDYSETGRRNNINNAYNIALFLNHKGFTPIISLISPYKDLREDLKNKGDVFECYIHTTEIRGRENFFAQNYEQPSANFLDIDTTGKEVSEVGLKIWNEIQNKQLNNK